MEYSNGFTEIWSLEHYVKLKNSTAFLAKSRLIPMSEVTALLPEMKSSAS